MDPFNESFATFHTFRPAALIISPVPSSSRSYVASTYSYAPFRHISSIHARRRIKINHKQTRPWSRHAAILLYDVDLIWLFNKTEHYQNRLKRLFVQSNDYYELIRSAVECTVGSYHCEIQIYVNDICNNLQCRIKFIYLAVCIGYQPLESVDVQQLCNHFGLSLNCVIYLTGLQHSY